MLEGEEPKANTEFALPKAGWDEVAAADEKGKMELDEPLVDDPNTGVLPLAAEEADAPNANTVEGDVELNVEPNNEEVLGVGQLAPNTLVVVPLLELIELASNEDVEELTPNGAEPNGLTAEVEEPNRELLE